MHQILFCRADGQME